MNEKTGEPGAGAKAVGQKIRMARDADSGDILDIYAPYVAGTAVSFETEVPTTEVFAARIAEIMRQYPFLVYEAGGSIVAYAYASAHRARDAYRYSVDVSVYAKEAYHGSGVAQQLYKCLFAILRRQGYFTACAGICVPNPQSERFHEKLGFSVVGTFHRTGYKFGAWHDVLWMEKPIRTYDEAPEALLPVGALPPEFLAETLRLDD